jgi:alkylated DNA repair dioxygenase AlkB
MDIPKSSATTRQMQSDLFESVNDPTRVDASFSTAKRTMLDAYSWVDVVPQWMSGSRELLVRVQENVHFEQLNRRLFDQVFREPRLTATFRDLRKVPHPELLEAIDALSQRYRNRYEGLWINFYRDGDDSTGWHRDRHAIRQPTSVVPVLTLGATRRFLLKPRSGGRSIVFKPSSGDLIVMGGRCQQDWVHSVPKDPHVTEPRISVNFQSAALAPAA